MTTNDIWILGASGRTGRDVAARLHAAGVPLVLAGRSAETLEALNSELGGGHRTAVGSLDTHVRALSVEPPAVVINTVGPFATTARLVAEGCPPGTHYVDLSNEFSGVDDILKLDDRAVANGQTLVAGSGYGVLGTESALLRACAGRPTPGRVRVDAIPALALEGGTVGAALAGSIVEVLAFGGREIRGGALVKSATGSHPFHVTTPEGDRVFTGGGASGELLAAWRASGASDVVAASIAVPENTFIRKVALPIGGGLIRIPGAPAFLAKRVAGVKLAGAPMSRAATWGHARVEWSDGSTAEGWLRVGDAGVFTADVMAEVSVRLLRGEGRPGAFTPGALFGPELAEHLGGVITTTFTPGSPSRVTPRATPRSTSNSTSGSPSSAPSSPATPSES